MKNVRENMSIIEALDSVQTQAQNSKLSMEFWNDVSDEIDFLTRTLGLTPIQIVFLSILCEQGEAVSWRGFGRHLGFSRLKMMGYNEEMMGFVKRRWVYRCGARERGGMYEGFEVMKGVVTAIRENRVFEPEKLDGYNTHQFVDRIVAYIEVEGLNNHISNQDHREWIIQLAKLNQHLPLAQKLLGLNSELEVMILAYAVSNYAQHAGTVREVMDLPELLNWFDEGWQARRVQRMLQESDCQLMREGWLEYDVDNGMVDCATYKLSQKAMDELLDGYIPTLGRRRRLYRDLVRYDQIKERSLFYNTSTGRQVKRLEQLLTEEYLMEVRSGLDACGMRQGVICLFYGAPGTGKTETVMQLARITGRNIMPVNIAGMRDKFVGESEKNIKNIFKSYRDLCKESERLPILLFNEADALIGNRFENIRSSVEKMDNAMQNIILQEMEDFEGIMIATTNLTKNIDKAFDRRFLFKVEFSLPDKDSRYQIWHSMLSSLGEKEMRKVSEKYDFSGGQIENVARKYKIERILDKGLGDVELLHSLCDEETLKRGEVGKIGY